MVRFAIWYRKLIRFINKCLSLVLFRSNSFTFILIWSGVVYLWMNLPNYPNIFLGVHKVRWLLVSVPQASNILVEEYSPRSQFWHIYCRQARFHAASLGQQTVLPILTYLPILKYLLLPPHAWSARIHAWTAHYSKRGSETHCLGRGENPP